MSEAGWAERKVERKLGGQYISLSPKLTAELLLAEHRRAVRAAKRHLDIYQRQREVEKDERKRDLLAGSIVACVDLLESLQRGRE
jgi:DNA topoisomerase VI subunit B